MEDKRFIYLILSWQRLAVETIIIVVAVVATTAPTGSSWGTKSTANGPLQHHAALLHGRGLGMSNVFLGEADLPRAELGELEHLTDIAASVDLLAAAATFSAADLSPDGHVFPSAVGAECYSVCQR